MKSLLFSFKGRIGRKKYWFGYSLNFLFFMLPLLIIFGLAGIITLMGAEQPLPEWIVLLNSKPAKAIATLLTLPIIVGGVYTGFAISAKRLHDLGYSGWNSFWLFVVIPVLLGLIAESLGTLASFVITTIFGCVKGTAGPNKYGDDPLLK